MGKLVNRIPGSRLLISSLPGSASRTHVESLADLTSVLKALPGKLDIKRYLPRILYVQDQYVQTGEIFALFLTLIVNSIS